MTEKNLITLTVDGREIETQEGENLLQVCLDHGIYIPNLCYMKGMEKPPGSCRLCFVEIEGENRPLASCTLRVEDGMIVQTDTPEVRRLQRSALRFLLSVHHVDCGKCPANKKCELQDLAKFLKVGLKPKNLDIHLKETFLDESHPCLEYYPNRCVLCGKCVYVCRISHQKSILTFAERGLETVISSYGENHSENPSCEECHACVDICPVSALLLKTKRVE
jgi:bidirectional [NiFe] hydrogenase diaphorase subunit